MDIVKNEAIKPENRPMQYDSTIKKKALKNIEAEMSVKYTPTLNAPVISSDGKMKFPIQSLVKIKENPESILNIQAEDVHNAHAVAKAVINISQYAGEVTQTDVNNLTNSLQKMYQDYSGSLDNIAQLGAIFVLSIDSADAVDWLLDGGNYEGTNFEKDFIKPYLNCLHQLKDPNSEGYITYTNFTEAKNQLSEFSKLSTEVIQAIENSDNASDLLDSSLGTIQENPAQHRKVFNFERDAYTKWKNLFKFLYNNKLINN